MQLPRIPPYRPTLQASSWTYEAYQGPHRIIIHAYRVLSSHLCMGLEEGRHAEERQQHQGVAAETHDPRLPQGQHQLAAILRSLPRITDPVCQLQA